MLKSILHSFVARTGETFRFVYSQTLQQVSWLNFRSKWIRDKPSKDVCSGPFSYLIKVRKKKGLEERSYWRGDPFLEILDFTRVNRLEYTRNGMCVPRDVAD